MGKTLEETQARVLKLERQLSDTAARLDRLCASAEQGASWESAAHLRNRVLYALRSIARDITKDIQES